MKYWSDFINTEEYKDYKNDFNLVSFWDIKGHLNM